MILLNDVLLIHQFLIDKYDGSNGARDVDSLESAIARPFKKDIEAKNLSPFFKKASAPGVRLIINHPLVDGNKRTGFLAIATLLRMVGGINCFTICSIRIHY